ncbi:DUF4293 domain-containing protein [Chitinophagaceae bacterium LWZ2-11]
MLQRIQSVWLLFASICAFLTLKLSFYSGNKLDATNAKVFSGLTATTSTLLLILTIAVAVASFVVIFLYKDRKRQLLLTIGVLVLSIIDISLFFSQTNKFVEGQYDITAFLPFVIPVLLLLALRGIWKDEQMVKKADRLR